jgi:hypothetical protein
MMAPFKTVAKKTAITVYRRSLAVAKTVAYVLKNLPHNSITAVKRLPVKVQLWSDRSFLRDAEEDMVNLQAESEARRSRLGRQDYTRVATMEIDSKMILAMDEVKKMRAKVMEKEEQLSSLSYR